MIDHALLAFTAAHLVSFYKPLLLFATFLPWAWLISSKLDKDARFYHLNYVMYNSIFLGSGVAALAAMLLVPIFWIGWPLGIALLAAPIYIYWQVRNREVPEKDRFELKALSLSSRLAARKKLKSANAAISFEDPAGKQKTCPPKDDPSFAIHMLAEDLIVPALEARATQVNVAVTNRGISVSQTIDGVRYKREAVPAESAMPLIDYVKGIAGLNVDDRRRRQSATCHVNGPTGRVEMTVVTAGSSAGQELRLAFNRSKRMHKPFDGLGLLPQQLEALRVFQEPHARHGIVLIGAPPGNGLTTSAYSFVARHDAYTCNIKTLEREIEATFDGVDQVRWNPNNPDVDYATNLQSILRRDPDIVLIAELKDKETARVAAEPGMEGPLIYVPQRGTSVGEQIRAWAKLVGDLKMAAAPLRAVVNQRLLRSVCPNCRQAYEPTPDLLKKMNLPAKKVTELYRASGKVQVRNKIETCPVCGGTGYFGQTGVFEVMVVSDEERRVLLTGDLKGTMAQARRNKMIYLQEAALSKAVSGETTVEEIVRVTSPARAASETPAKPRVDRAPSAT